MQTNNPKDLVEYQSCSVVSKTLVKKDTGSVTLFAFDQDQGLSEHTAPFDAIIYVLEGRAEITIDGKAHFLGQNELITMPANKPHSLKAINKFKMMLIMIKS